MEAFGDGLCEIEPEFPLGGLHEGEGREGAFPLQQAEGLSVAERREMVEDADTAGGLLECEVAHVADEEDELLLVVGTAVRFGGGLDDDDAGLVG